MTAVHPADGRRWWRVVAILFVAAFAIRAVQFGNPHINVDENFYLLVGDRMLHGALPYVDIWDRKPIGLFLIYAATRLPGGDGIVQYQIVATLFAAGTAILVARIAWSMATPAAAAVAGIFYLLLLGLAGGQGGQAPVFYNLFVAGAALATLRAFAGGEPGTATIRRSGAIAMLLAGIAMQIKYTALFESLFFGMLLLWCSWRQDRNPARTAMDAGLWIVLALAPTIAAFLYYLAQGQAPAFVYANFLSIGGRSGADGAELARRLGKTWLVLNVPVFAVVLTAALEPWRRFPQGARVFAFVMMWLGAAIAGYLVFGTYFDHYALPLMVPIAVGCAPLFTHRPRHIGIAAAAILLVLGALGYRAEVRRITGGYTGRQATAAAVAAIVPRLRGGCLYVYDGDPVLYYLTRACIPGRYAFPAHLNLTREANAIGVDPLDEIRRIMATGPAVVVDTIGGTEPDENPIATALFRSTLRGRYRQVAAIPFKKTHTLIYERLPPR